MINRWEHYRFLKKKLGLYSLHFGEKFLMILELGNTEYLCKLFPYIWLVTESKMEGKFAGVLILWAQNYLAQLRCHFSYGELHTQNSPISSYKKTMEWDIWNLFSVLVSSIIFLVTWNLYMYKAEKLSVRLYV